MADINFPAHITVQREPDVDGLPVLIASVTVSEEVAGHPLPPGPAGDQGDQGRPRTTFRKMGDIANDAARPAGLGAADRGKWWHRLDNNGMDVWTGTEWKHSANAVGPRGPIAQANTIANVTTVHDAKLTQPAVKFTGTTAAQTLAVTAPAGEQGPKGPAGSSGAITESPDFDKANGPIPGGVFAYNRASRKFRAAPPPMGAGPWAWFDTDFQTDKKADTPQIIVGTFTIPAQPFAWRPTVYGYGTVAADFPKGSAVRAEAVVRLHHSQGPILAGAIAFAGELTYLPIVPNIRDEQATKSLSPSSDYGVVAAGVAANLIVAVERTGGDTGNIAWSRARASLVVHAQPIGVR